MAVLAIGAAIAALWFASLAGPGGVFIFSVIMFVICWQRADKVSQRAAELGDPWMPKSALDHASFFGAVFIFPGLAISSLLFCIAR